MIAVVVGRSTLLEGLEEEDLELGFCMTFVVRWINCGWIWNVTQ